MKVTPEAGWPMHIARELIPLRLGSTSDPKARRLAERIASRAAAERLLVAAGAPKNAKVAGGAHGAPRWPEGWVGSISHSREEVLACVASRARFVALGCDVEREVAWEPESLQVAFTLAEQERLENDARQATAWFGRKEAAQKCLFAATGGWVDFQRLELRVDPRAASWRIERADGADDVWRRLEGMSWREAERLVSLAWIAA